MGKVREHVLDRTQDTATGVAEAAGLLEETTGRCPPLRERHPTRLMTWRRGVIM
ncbi:hypothetical protein [Streptomyces africanus]|uniref:hypothetical protein n=1 Tax=Streptomyces africanus TaxID=231024 RepID=UPI001302BEB5|nr:hypothetical protein [Streptomyces africanus]